MYLKTYWRGLTLTSTVLRNRQTDMFGISRWKLHVITANIPVWWILRILDHAASWYLNKGRPTWWHLLYYVDLLLSMFRMLIHPSSGACDYLVRYCVGCNVLTWGVLVLCSGIGCWWCGIRVQAGSDVLTSETCWAVNWHNKASVIKMVYLYSNIKMMHGPIRIRFTIIHYLFVISL